MSNENKTIGQHSNTPQSPEVLQGKSYIFAVGINQYERCPPLYNAVKDAQHVVNLLTSKYQFDPAAVTVLFDKEATRRNIYRQLENLAHKVAPEDNLLIYFSGHGTYKNIIDEGFWVPVDGDLEDPGSFIANSSIIKYLKAIRAHHIVIISDACFSGALFTEKFVGVRERQETIPSRWLMTSGRNEVVSDGKPGQHSPFADSLLLHLNSNKEEVLPVTKLSDAILEDVGGNSSQLPRCEPLRDVGHRGGEFMFRFKGSVAPPHSYDQKQHSRQDEGRNHHQDEERRSRFGRIIKHPATKATALVLTTLIAGFLVWAEFFNKPSAPAKPPRTYNVVQDAGESLLIVQGSNGRYGYASKADTALAISCKYEEAHAFRDGLARVKRNGKYGWIRPDSSSAIAEKYDYAGDFEDGQAEVVAGRDTFSIDKNGARQQVNSVEIDPAPQFATIQVSPVSKNLGKISRGSTGTFQFTITNNSNINAKITSITPSSNFVTIATQQFTIPPGGSKAITVTWRTGTSTGNRTCTIEVKGSNLAQNRKIDVTAEVIVPSVGTPGERAGTIAGSNIPPPPRADKEQQIKIQTQIPSDVKMWLVTDEGKRIDAVNAAFTIPASLSGKSVKVFFKKNSKQDWERVRIGRDEISLPDGF